MAVIKKRDGLKIQIALLILTRGAGPGKVSYSLLIFYFLFTLSFFTYFIFLSFLSTEQDTLPGPRILYAYQCSNTVHVAGLSNQQSSVYKIHG